MNWKEFLRLEWKKIIIPVIFIVLFLNIINTLHSFGLIEDKYACDISRGIRDIKEFRKRNDTSPVNTTINRLENLSESMTDEIVAIVNELLYLPAIYSFAFIRVIDPFFPTSCEFYAGIGNYEFCQYYMSEETYDCIINALPGPNTFIGVDLWRDEFKSYTELGVPVLLFNIIFLFIEGYIISCLIVFIYRKIRGYKKRVEDFSDIPKVA